MTLEAIFAALALQPSAAQSSALLAYVDLLQRWNTTFNLTAVRDRESMLTQHLADCLAVVHPLRRHSPGPLRLLDVGSGGGLPGVVIGILLPDCEVTCIDAVGKKAAFVRQVAGTLSLDNLHAHHGRIEDLRDGPYGVITSRAFSSLVDFARLSRPLLKAGGVWMAMKGRVPDDEVAELPEDVKVFHVEQLAVPGLEAKRCLIWMRLKSHAAAP